MTLSTFIKKSKIQYLLVGLVMAFAMNSPEAQAQDDNGPTGYCNLECSNYRGTPFSYTYYATDNRCCFPVFYPTQYPYYSNGYFNNSIARVRMYAGDELVFQRNSPDMDDNAFEDCYVWTGAEAELQAGETYRVETTTWLTYYNYYETDYCEYYTSLYGSYSLYYTFRMFIDWNMDGDWDDVGEWINETEANASSMNPGNSWRGYYTCNTNHIWNYNITIPDDIPLGKTRMRVMTSYYYPYPTTSIYNGQPNDPCWNGYLYFSPPPTPYYGYMYGETEDYLLNFSIPFKETFPSDKEPDNVLFAGEWYNGETRMMEDESINYFKKPMVKLGSPQSEGAMMTFKIKGPLPDGGTVYQALDVNTGSTMIDISAGSDNITDEVFIYMQNSTGSMSDGNGNVKFTGGGEYQVILEYYQEPGAEAKEAKKNFTVSWPYDLAVVQNISPKTDKAPYFKQYISGLTISVQAEIQNTGLNPVYRFDYVTKIFSPSGEQIDEFSGTWDTANLDQQAIMPLQKVVLTLGQINYNQTGIYTMVTEVDLLSANDYEPYNDRHARIDMEPYTFAIQDEIQAASVEVVNPAEGDTVYAGRPFIPVGQFENRGIGDISDAQAYIRIKKLPDGAEQEFEITVQDIPSGRYNQKSARFEPITLLEPGKYEATLVIDADGDNQPDDDVITSIFYVIDGIQGDIYVGQGRRYETISEFTDDLFLKGMTGSVTVYLTDAAYEEHSVFPDEPALYLTSYINGLGYDEETGEINTLTFRAAPQRASTRAGVVIDLYSGNGQGIAIGQAENSVNKNALIRTNLGADLARKFSNFNGYVTFDGGSAKALKFRLHSQNKVHGAVFYLGRGTENVTLKNLLLENAETELENRTWLPRTGFNTVDGFIFQKDMLISEDPQGYSAGIVNRSTLFDGKTAFEVVDQEGVEAEISLNLDTIPNTNILIENNEIDGFGYGVVSLGIGALIDEETSTYEPYYNYNNVIRNNLISNVAGGGIVIGNEENIVVENNQIYNIHGMGEVSGIMAGLSETEEFFGYNNIDVEITGNKIYNLSGGTKVTGINVHQSVNRYVSLVGQGFETFPYKADNITVMNNAIWNVGAEVSTATRAGIHVLTNRNPELTGLNQLMTPKYGNYKIRESKIVNNTVIIKEDGYQTSGLIAGIGLQQVDGLIFKNNAIAILDTDVDGVNEVSAGMFYQGTMPKKGEIVSDYNVYSVLGDNAIVRYVQTDENSNIISTGTRNEYNTLSQWQMWTNSDINSVSGKNFVDDMVVSDMSLIMKPNNQLKGSILSDRGQRLDYVEVDVNGKERGTAGERYDIGAFEFDGEMYNRDAQVMTLLDGVYKETEGTFSDAEYVMTDMPIEISTRIRNNSSTDMAQTAITVKIEQEMPNGEFELFMPVKTVRHDIEATESIDVSFGLADGQAGDDFMPRTYGDYLGAYNVPSEFAGMEYNVTPLYRITISVGSDEEMSNNVYSKEVRYYVNRSPWSLMMSASEYSADATGSSDAIASNLNVNAYHTAMMDMGWYNDHNFMVTIGTYDVMVTPETVLKDRRDGEDDYTYWNILNELEGTVRLEADVTMVGTSYYADAIYIVDELSDTRDIEGNLVKGDKFIGPRHDIDFFYRAGWQSRTTDYSTYRIAFWSDGDNDVLSRYQVEDLERYLKSGDSEVKRNLVIGSEEFIRNNDANFTGTNMRAESRYPHTPLGMGDNNYDGYTVTGVSIARNLQTGIMETGVAGDSYPMPGLMNIMEEGNGIARIAYIYDKVENDENEEIPESGRVMGVAATSLDRNVITLGIDWRHFDNLANVLRGTFDFLKNNGGEVVPVELLSFEAMQNGSRVELNWSTASEQNSDRFEVERADVSGAGQTDFVKIDEVRAAGNSSIVNRYGTTDAKVSLGNTYVYRLKMLDTDGEFSYSDEAVVTLEGEGISWVENPVPNPASESSVLRYNMSSSQDVEIKLYDMNGKALMTLSNGVSTSGINEVEIDVNNLASGTYKVVLRSGSTVLSKNLSVVK
jgi:hypothetical protein